MCHLSHLGCRHTITNRAWLRFVVVFVHLFGLQEAAPLLDNPLRNGLLLAAVAAAATTQPGSNAIAGAAAAAAVAARLVHGVVDPPRDVRSARGNIMAALDHLGLLDAACASPTCVAGLWGCLLEWVPWQLAPGVGGAQSAR